MLSGQVDSAKSDSVKLYQNIEKYSKKNKFNTFMYEHIFRPVAINSSSKNNHRMFSEYESEVNSFNEFEGKIIRNIFITTYDPFCTRNTDSIKKLRNYVINGGNKIHVKSNNKTIRNLLLIKQNQRFDSFLVKESERLIRSQVYVHDVSFEVVHVSAGSDSVDIFISEFDNWALNPDGSLSSTNVVAELNDNNFLGTGHKFQNTYYRNISNGKNGLNTDYIIPNIKNTYISTMFHYDIDEFDNSSKSIEINRPFYSSFAKWAGGASVISRFRIDSFRNNKAEYEHSNLDYLTQDYWLGKSFQVFKRNTGKNRAINLIIATRYTNIKYDDRPSITFDSMQFYSNEDFYLVGMGISTRKYIQDKYMFKFGLIEYVPVGSMYVLTGGYQVRQNTERLYGGFRISFGNYHNWGYLNNDFEIGTFYNGSGIEQGVFNAGIDYFTRLFVLGNWKFRQFAKSRITYGFNRFVYDSLTLNNGNGIDGFNSSTISGTQRIIFEFKTQSYTPWNIYGFHIGPYLTYSFGLLADDKSGFSKSRVYSQLGLGILIKNEFLVFNTFQLSVSFYPVIPGTGQNILKRNTIQTDEYGLKDFEIGKPAAAVYR